MAGLGDEFRAAREARHLSLSDVSEQIHIRSVYLQSLEDEDWAAIAAPVYVRGFIRTYARFLGLDPELAVGRFNGALGEAADRRHEPVAVRSSQRRRPSFWLWGAIAVAVLLVAFVGYNYFELQDSDKYPVVVDSAAPAPAQVDSAAPALAPSAPTASPTAATHVAAPVAVAPPPSPAPKPAASVGGKLEMRLIEPSWVFVKVDGIKRLEATLPAGTTRDFGGGKTVSIRVGNAGGVDLRLNGKDLGLMGHSGAVVDRTLALANE
jgi:cytoskeletal protein RodZ